MILTIDDVLSKLAEPFLGLQPTGESVWEIYVRDDRLRFERALQDPSTQSVKRYMEEVSSVMSSYSFLGQPARRNREMEVLGLAYATLSDRFGSDEENSFFRVAKHELETQYHPLLVQWQGLITRNDEKREEKPVGYKATVRSGH